MHKNAKTTKKTLHVGHEFQLYNGYYTRYLCDGADLRAELSFKHEEKYYP